MQTDARSAPERFLRLGLLLSDFHDAWPWSAARWSFVGARLAELAPQCWYGSRQDVSKALASARTVHALDDPHLAGLWPDAVKRRAVVETLFRQLLEILDVSGCNVRPEFEGHFAGTGGKNGNFAHIDSLMADG